MSPGFAKLVRDRLGFDPVAAVAAGRARGWVGDAPAAPHAPDGVVVGRTEAARYLGIGVVRTTRMCRKYGVRVGRDGWKRTYERADLDALKARLAARELARGEAEVISAVRALRNRQWTAQDINETVLTASKSTYQHWIRVLITRGMVRCVRAACGNLPAVYETVHGHQTAQPMSTEHLHREVAA